MVLQDTTHEGDLLLRMAPGGRNSHAECMRQTIVIYNPMETPGFDYILYDEDMPDWLDT